MFSGGKPHFVERINGDRSQVTNKRILFLNKPVSTWSCMVSSDGMCNGLGF
jgi:hypothetical protein